MQWHGKFCYKETKATNKSNHMKERETEIDGHKKKRETNRERLSERYKQ